MQWETKGQQVTEVTQKHLGSILACLLSLACVAVTLYRPRGQHIAHCSTTEHNDRQRGDTKSLFRFLSPRQASLLIRVDVFFYVSLVSFRGIALLPICIHPPTKPGEEAIIKAYIWSSDGTAGEATLPYSFVDSSDWSTIGLLDVVVCGLRAGQVLCSPRLNVDKYNETAFTSTTQCDVLTFADALRQAKSNPAPRFPVKWIGLGWCGDWCGLFGWMLPHLLIGDGAVGRVHLYSRMVSSNPTSVTAKRDRTDLLEVDWSEILKVTMSWEGRTRRTSKKY